MGDKKALLLKVHLQEKSGPMPVVRHEAGVVGG